MPKRERAPTFVPDDAYSEADWDEVSDNPPLTDAELAAARPGPGGMPAAMAEEFARRGGRPRSEEKAVPVSLRVPPAVLAAYKAQGPGWQTRMNEVLAAGVAPGTAAREAERPDRQAPNSARAGAPVPE